MIVTRVVVSVNVVIRVDVLSVTVNHVVARDVRADQDRIVDLNVIVNLVNVAIVVMAHDQDHHERVPHPEVVHETVPHR